MTQFKSLAIPAIAFATAMAVSTPVSAGKIENACNASDRRASSRSLCSCIQSVADQLLTRREQSTAAKFFKDPHQAQEIRQSDNSRDEKFWVRYKQFGSVASRRCS